MGSGMTFRKLGVAVVATAFTALVGITAASAGATTGSMAGQGGTAGGGASSPHQNQCEARADKRHLAGDQRDSYVKRCMTSAGSHRKKSAKPSSAMQGGGTGNQMQQGGSTNSQ